MRMRMARTATSSQQNNQAAQLAPHLGPTIKPNQPMSTSTGIRQPALPRSVRLVTVLLWLTLCAVSASWAMTLLRGPSLSAGSITPSGSNRPAIDPATTANALQSHAQLFGATGVSTANAPAQKRESLRALGIIADRKGRGAVLLSIDGQPARPYRTGDQVAGRTVRAVRGNEVEFDHNGQSEILNVPPPGSLSTTGPATGPPTASTRAPGRLGGRDAVLSNLPAAKTAGPTQANP